MTKEEFKPIAKKLITAYGDADEKFLCDKPRLDFWLTMLQDLDAAKLNAAVDSYIKRERYRPMIADIRNEYAMIESRCREYNDRTNSNYYKAMHEYPYYEDTDEARAIFWSIVKSPGSTWKQTLENSERIIDRTRAFVMVHLEHADKLPTWTEFLRNELRSRS